MEWTTELEYLDGYFHEVYIPDAHNYDRGTCEVFGSCAIQYGSEILAEAIKGWISTL